MKPKNIFNALAFALVLATAITGAPAQEKEATVPDALTVIHSRKSVRSFTGEPVTREALETVIRAGMAAPTAVNFQPWAFVAVTDRAKLDALRDGLPYAKMLDKAGAAIIVCAIPEKAFGQSREYAVIDATCAGENILLAVEATGLGAVWTAGYPDEDRMELIRKILGIPESVIPLTVIPVGHPTGEDKPKDKFKAENIHWDQW